MSKAFSLDGHKMITPRKIDRGISYTCECGHTQDFDGPRRPHIGVWAAAHKADMAVKWQVETNPQIDWSFIK